jgi:hypothetical protein
LDLGFQFFGYLGLSINWKFKIQNLNLKTIKIHVNLKYNFLKILEMGLSIYLKFLYFKLPFSKFLIDLLSNQTKIKYPGQLG